MIFSIFMDMCNHCYCSVAQSCLTLCDPMDCSTSGFPVLHCLPEFAKTHVHWVDDAIQPSHPLSPPSPSAINLSQHQGLFLWVSSSQQMAKVLELQFQHQSFEWIFRLISFRVNWFDLYGLYGYNSLFIHLPVERHLVASVLAIMNKAAITISMQAFIWASVFKSNG